MKLTYFVVAAVALSIERICYVWAYRRPESFRNVCAMVDRSGSPVTLLRKLFYGFKAIQLLVFFGWCLVYGNGYLMPVQAGAFAVGGVLIATGQLLNFSVFHRLGEVGVFYGNRYGYDIPWSNEFPFSLLKHPQYVGAVLSIWGFFVALRFPHADWALIPCLETAYYVAGACLEQ